MFSRFTNRNRKPSKAQAWWEWNRPSGRKRRPARRLWAGFAAGGLLGTLAGTAMLIAARKRQGGETQALARSGQPPGRSHIQISSHPAAQARKSG